MKKLFAITFIVVALAFVFPGCKRGGGENATPADNASAISDKSGTMGAKAIEVDGSSASPEVNGKNIGPFGGYITCLLTVPVASPAAGEANFNLYAGTYDKGIFKSKDGGANWYPVNNGITDGAIRALVLDKSNNIYAGTDGNGIFKTTNNGSSWFNDGRQNYDSSIQTLAVGNDGSVYAGTYYGLFKRTDASNVWSQVGANTIGNQSINALAIDSQGYIYAGGNFNGIYKIMNSGINVTLISGITAAYHISAFAVSANKLYAASHDNENQYVFMSSNGSDSWSNITSQKLLGQYIITLVVDNEDNVYAGTDNGGIFKRKKAGGSWYEVNQYLTNKTVIALTVDTDGRMYAATTGGVFKTTNNGSSWFPVNRGITGLATMSIIMDASGNLYAGTYEYGILKTSDDGLTWTTLSNGLEGLEIKALTKDPAGNIYTVTNRGVFKTTDEGVSWTGVNNNTLPEGVIFANSRTILVTGENDSVYLGTDFGVWKTTGITSSWLSMNNGFTLNDPQNNPEFDIQVLAADLAGNIYAGTYGNGIFKTSDGGSSWFPVNSGLTDQSVIDLVIDASGAIIASTYSEDGGIFISTDGGSSWTLADNSLSNISKTYLLPKGDGNLYIATDMGIFKSAIIPQAVPAVAPESPTPTDPTPEPGPAPTPPGPPILPPTPDGADSGGGGCSLLSRKLIEQNSDAAALISILILQISIGAIVIARRMKRMR